MRASSTPESIKIIWTTTIQKISLSLIFDKSIKAAKRLIPEMVTMDATSFNFNSLKSTVPIQVGLSSLSSATCI